MIIALGLVILAAAAVVGVSGVMNNRGATHGLNHQFTVLGQHFNGSAGALFLYGIVLGAIALAGLWLLLSGANRTARRARQSRQELKKTRLEMEAVARDRDQLAAAAAGDQQASPFSTYGPPMPPPPAVTTHRAG